jgi:signal transduction histidine kinase
MSRGDRDALIQVFGHLLVNPMKHAGRGCLEVAQPGSAQLRPELALNQ